jgi:voltage-gated potassium channel
MSMSTWLRIWHTSGRIIAFAVLMIGLGFVSVPAGLVASALSKAREMEE